MAAVAYATLGAGTELVAVGTALGNLALLGVTTFALAAFGYLLNDVGDREADALLGAPNAALAAGPRRTAIGLAILGAASALPWLWLPHTPTILALLGLEVVLFCAYVLPPLRLKERGLAGIATDATYGYVLPLLVARLAFEAVSGESAAPWAIATLIAWAFTLGVRQILGHQLMDAGHDERVGTATFALRHGWGRSLTLLGRVTIAEALLFPLALLGFGATGPVALGGLAIFTAWVLATRPRRSLRGAIPIHRLDVISRINLLGGDVMSTFHVRWLPLLLALALAVRDPAYLLVVAAHAIVFTTPLGEWRRLRRPSLHRLRSSR